MSATPETDAELNAIKSVIKDEFMLETMADFSRKLERERDEARAACPAGEWVASADYDRLHTATSRLLVAVNNLPVLAFAMVQRDWHHACDVTYGRGS